MLLQGCTNCQRSQLETWFQAPGSTSFPTRVCCCNMSRTTFQGVFTTVSFPKMRSRRENSPLLWFKARCTRPVWTRLKVKQLVTVGRNERYSLEATYLWISATERLLVFGLVFESARNNGACFQVTEILSLEPYKRCRCESVP